jgi:hypothetical protein
MPWQTPRFLFEYRGLYKSPDITRGFKWLGAGSAS